MISIKKKALVLGLSAVTALSFCCGMTACFNSGEKDNYDKIDSMRDFLTVDGELVKNADGETVFLRGVNAGGLFVTEHWMTGFTYGSSDSDDYRSLTKMFINRFGEEDTKALWEEYRANWWTETDFKNCADMGMTVIRLPFSYMNVDFDAITDYENAGINYDFSALDEFVDTAAEYGLYTILDLHGAYGSQNGQDHSGQIIGSASDVDFYSNTKMMGLTAKLWGELAEHYKDNPAVAGYDILNEPGEKAGSTTTRHWNFYDQVYKAIRATGDNHIVIFESCWDGQNLPKTTQYGWQNCIYSFHHYAGNTLSEVEFDVNWNNKIANVTTQNFGVPLQMGEFTSYENAYNWEYTLDLLNRSNWHWTSWTYKIWGSSAWGVVNIIGNNREKVNANTDTYEQILEKFKKLRTDGESAKKHMLYNWVPAEGQDEYVQKEYRTLEDILKEYCNAPGFEQKLKEGSYVFSVENGGLSMDKTIGNSSVLSVGGEGTAVTVSYHSSKDGSAYISIGGSNLTVTAIDGVNYLTLKNSTATAARFYPVVTADGGVAFVSFSTAKYLKINDDGAVTADANYLSDATVFYGQMAN